VAQHGKGIGRALLNAVIAQAEQRGDHTLVLEVFEQNTPALKLYESVGFRTVQRLFNYQTEGLTPHADERLAPLDICDVAALVTRYGAPDLPWQLAGPHCFRLTPPNAAFQLGPAYAIISDPGGATIRIHALLTLPDQQRQGHATRLLRALAAHITAAHITAAHITTPRWMIPALCPERYGGFFLHLGFTQAALNQCQMQLALTRNG
jgi:ribosomal protein S18 acetylase RimI-like enzyme